MAKRTRQPGFKRNRNPVTWLLRHAQMSLSSLGRLSRSPLTTLMTATVIGIALALPSGLHLIVDNVRQLSSSWDGSASISLFLNQSVSDEQAEQVRATVAKRTDVAESRLISRSAALDEFQAAVGDQRACVAADIRFHLSIARATGNEHFADFMQHLGETIIPRARVNTAKLAGDDFAQYLYRVNREHEDIYNAIRRQDPEAARAAMRTHLSNSRERLVRVQEEAERAAAG